MVIRDHCRGLSKPEGSGLRRRSSVMWVEGDRRGIQDGRVRRTGGTRWPRTGGGQGPTVGQDGESIAETAGGFTCRPRSACTRLAAGDYTGGRSSGSMCATGKVEPVLTVMTAGHEAGRTTLVFAATEHYGSRLRQVHADCPSHGGLYHARSMECVRLLSAPASMASARKTADRICRRDIRNAGCSA